MVAEDKNTAEHYWTVDKRVPIALIFVLLIQTFAIGWWASATDARVSTLERRMDAAAPQAERLTRVEVKLETVQSGIDEIKQLIRNRIAPQYLHSKI